MEVVVFATHEETVLAEVQTVLDDGVDVEANCNHQGNKNECARDLGYSRNTVIRWWIFYENLLYKKL